MGSNNRWGYRHTPLKKQIHIPSDRMALSVGAGDGYQGNEDGSASAARAGVRACGARARPTRMREHVDDGNRDGDCVHG